MSLTAHDQSFTKQQTMKKHLYFSIAFALTANLAFAQIFQFNPYVGYTTSSKLEMNLGKYRTSGDMNFGANVSFGRGISGAASPKTLFWNFNTTFAKLTSNFAGTAAEKSLWMKLPRTTSWPASPKAAATAK
jgi:hypothetical protein